MSIYSTISAALKGACPTQRTSPHEDITALMARQWQHAVDCQAIANALLDRDDSFDSHKFLSECNPNSEGAFL